MSTELCSVRGASLLSAFRDFPACRPFHFLPETGGQVSIFSVVERWKPYLNEKIRPTSYV